MNVGLVFERTAVPPVILNSISFADKVAEDDAEPPKTSSLNEIVTEALSEVKLLIELIEGTELSTLNVMLSVPLYALPETSEPEKVTVVIPVKVSGGSQL